MLEAARTPYPAARADGPFNLLVFGGSQGARFMSDLVPPAIAALPAETRRLIRVTQQCRPEDIDRVRDAYAGMGVEADLRPFFDDMPARIAAAHLVVSRSGASTVAELRVIGRPAIMVPLPNALDQDQKANAEVLARAGGGWMVEQRDMNPAGSRTILPSSSPIRGGSPIRPRRRRGSAGPTPPTSSPTWSRRWPQHKPFKGGASA